MLKKIITKIYLFFFFILAIPCQAQEFPNPLKGVNNIPDLIGNIINGVLGLTGSLSLLMFIYGGITWMTSGGSEEKIKKGKGILTWAVLGILVVFTSYSVLNLVFDILAK